MKEEYRVWKVDSSECKTDDMEILKKLIPCRS